MRWFYKKLQVVNTRGRRHLAIQQQAAYPKWSSSKETPKQHCLAIPQQLGLCLPCLGSPENTFTVFSCKAVPVCPSKKDLTRGNINGLLLLGLVAWAGFCREPLRELISFIQWHEVFKRKITVAEIVLVPCHSPKLEMPQLEQFSVAAWIRKVTHKPRRMFLKMLIVVFRVQFDVTLVFPSVQEDKNVTNMLFLIYYYELWYKQEESIICNYNTELG